MPRPDAELPSLSGRCWSASSLPNVEPITCAPLISCSCSRAAWRLGSGSASCSVSTEIVGCHHPDLLRQIAFSLDQAPNQCLQLAAQRRQRNVKLETH